MAGRRKRRKLPPPPVRDGWDAKDAKRLRTTLRSNPDCPEEALFLAFGAAAQKGERLPRRVVFARLEPMRARRAHLDQALIKHLCAHGLLDCDTLPEDGLYFRLTKRGVNALRAWILSLPTETRELYGMPVGSD